MTRRLLVSTRCPLCNNEVDIIPDHILKKSEDHQNCEFVVTKRGLKQYFHTTCFNELIKKQHEEKEEHHV